MNSATHLSCANYHVAWICPVADIELLPARLMLDKEHTTPTYNTHFDENTYICGELNGHNVVVATCPCGATGNISAGRLTASLFKTFPNIQMALLVGIGSGVPQRSISEDSLENIHLGDVVVGWPGDGKPASVYYNQSGSDIDSFETTSAIQNPDWRLTSALSILISDHELGQTTFDKQLARLKIQRKSKKRFIHPGLEHDKLFDAAYHHPANANHADCSQCDQSELVQRPQRTEEDIHELIFHQGRIAITNTTVQASELRDTISERCDGAICIETEAAGVDINRRCLIIRGISDYGDSHKNNIWSLYAAGNAAAFARELLCRIQADSVRIMGEIEKKSEAPWIVPFPRPRNFIGREAELAQLRAHISSENCHRLAIYGLGGSGKTALALELIYRMRKHQQPPCAIFWVPAISQESFERAYAEIGMRLSIPGIEDSNANVKQLVKARLSDETLQQSWCMVVDNADDVAVLLDDLQEDGEQTRLIDYLPSSSKGSIIFTTRTRAAAVKFAENSVIALGELSQTEAKEVLSTRLLNADQVQDEAVVDEFLGILTCLALAIVQAIAFINTNDITLANYISLYRKSEADAFSLLNEEFEAQGRYYGTKNPVATTWFISFEQIQKQDSWASHFLAFMSCIDNNNIPARLLPASGASEIEHMKAIGTLKAYAFLVERQQENDRQNAAEKKFDMHPLVHISMKGWLKSHNQWKHSVEDAVDRLLEVGYKDNKTKDGWTAYLMHATAILDTPEVYDANRWPSLLRQVGRCEIKLGKYKAAEQTHRRLYEHHLKEYGEVNRATLASLCDVANAKFSQGDHAEAEMLYRRGLVIVEQIPEMGETEKLTLMSNLASALGPQGRSEEAEAIQREILTQSLDHLELGDSHPRTLSSMSSLGQMLYRQRKYEEAENIQRETLEKRREALGAEHPSTLNTFNSLAQMLATRGKSEEAELMMKEMLPIYEKVYGTDHPLTLRTKNSMALVLCDRGKHREALEVYYHAIPLFIKALGAMHQSVVSHMKRMAARLARDEKYAAAEQIYRETLALEEESVGKVHEVPFWTRKKIGRMLRSQRKNAEAEQLYWETLSLITGDETRNPEALEIMRYLIKVLKRQGKHAEAEEVQGWVLELGEGGVA